MIVHVTIATEGRFPLTELLALVLAVVRAAGPGLLLFAVVDEHVHLVMNGDPSAVAHRVSGVSRAIGARVSIGILPARIRPVADRSHLRNLVGYVVGQPRRHGAGSWDGTCLPDLVGARRIGFHPAPLAALLPREDLAASAMAGAGCNVRACLPAADAQVRAHGPDRAHGAALAVSAWAARGERSFARAAHDRAWRGLSDAVGFGEAARLAAGIGERTWRRLGGEPADPAHVDAIRRRIALEVALAAGEREATPAGHGHSCPPRTAGIRPLPPGMAAHAPDEWPESGHSRWG